MTDREFSELRVYAEAPDQCIDMGAPPFTASRSSSFTASLVLQFSNEQAQLLGPILDPLVDLLVLREGGADGTEEVDVRRVVEPPDERFVNSELKV